MKRVFTTGQVARIFSVNINTVIKWFDEGKLDGFRLPRSNERRIYRNSVQAFMSKHDISPSLLRDYDEELRARQRARTQARGGNGRRTGAAGPGGPEQRVFARKPVDLTAKVITPSGVEDAVKVRNLSLGGAYITGFAPADKLFPDEFQLSVPETDDGPAWEGVCQLIHLRRNDDETMNPGCRFTRVDPGALQTYLT